MLKPRWSVFVSPPLEGTSSENPSHACRQKLVIWLCSLCLLQSFGISVLMSMLRSYHEDLENEIEEFKCHGKRETILWLCDYEVLQSWCPTRMCGIQSAFEFTKSLGPWEYILGRFEARPPRPHFPGQSWRWQISTEMAKFLTTSCLDRIRKKDYIYFYIYIYSSLDAVKIPLAGPRLAETVQKEQNVVTCPHLNLSIRIVRRMCVPSLHLPCIFPFNLSLGQKKCYFVARRFASCQNWILQPRKPPEGSKLSKQWKPVRASTDGACLSNRASSWEIQKMQKLQLHMLVQQCAPKPCK